MQEPVIVHLMVRASPDPNDARSQNPTRNRYRAYFDRRAWMKRRVEKRKSGKKKKKTETRLCGLMRCTVHPPLGASISPSLPLEACSGPYRRICGVTAFFSKLGPHPAVRMFRRAVKVTGRNSQSASGAGAEDTWRGRGAERNNKSRSQQAASCSCFFSSTLSPSRYLASFELASRRNIPEQRILS
jgi:hypothetical protein